MRVITTARKRVSDVTTQDVVFVATGRNDRPAWRFVYDALCGDEIDVNEYDAASIRELVKVVGPLGDLENRDTVLRVAVDEDRTEGPGANQDAWVRFRNPYTLIEFQIEVESEVEP